MVVSPSPPASRLPSTPRPLVGPHMGPDRLLLRRGPPAGLLPDWRLRRPAPLRGLQRPAAGHRRRDDAGDRRQPGPLLRREPGRRVQRAGVDDPGGGRRLRRGGMRGGHKRVLPRQPGGEEGREGGGVQEHVPGDGGR
ncbi:thaumatin-like protein [Phtheirospermum japonicum]|uniref:Thaumatin-like protein n=1 Tax=Phtheirospermum japonicum TaxID=374723 RepID=A0A830BJL2_9LAMI|nr:thaumatin-like protein [Phtheirospermum japonicum]GFQ01536.1 thaumatin-like protein [Phtheirospermum japonicum]